MVTDFMESDLRRIIKSKQQISPERVRSYMAQLLAGLHHVHSVSSIHRDLKPANILVSPSSISPATPHGLLRLCDFGLARVDGNAAQVLASPPRPLTPPGPLTPTHGHAPSHTHTHTQARLLPCADEA